MRQSPQVGGCWLMSSLPTCSSHTLDWKREKGVEQKRKCRGESGGLECPVFPLSPPTHFLCSLPLFLLQPREWEEQRLAHPHTIREGRAFGIPPPTSGRRDLSLALLGLVCCTWAGAERAGAVQLNPSPCSGGVITVTPSLQRQCWE